MVSMGSVMGAEEWNMSGAGGRNPLISLSSVQAYHQVTKQVGNIVGHLFKAFRKTLGDIFWF